MFRNRRKNQTPRLCQSGALSSERDRPGAGQPRLRPRATAATITIRNKISHQGKRAPPLFRREFLRLWRRFIFPGVAGETPISRSRVMRHYLGGEKLDGAHCLFVGQVAPLERADKVVGSGLHVFIKVLSHGVGGARDAGGSQTRPGFGGTGWPVGLGWTVGRGPGALPAREPCWGRILALEPRNWFSPRFSASNRRGAPRFHRYLSHAGEAWAVAPASVSSRSRCIIKPILGSGPCEVASGSPCRSSHNSRNRST